MNMVNKSKLRTSQSSKKAKPSKTPDRKNEKFGDIDIVIIAALIIPFIPP